jgi:hypothetical protein
VDASCNELIWPCEEVELDLEIVRRLPWSETDAIVSAFNVEVERNGAKEKRKSEA